MSVARYPVPDSWTDRRGQFLFSIGLFAVFTMLCAMWTIRVLAVGELPTVLVSIPLGIGAGALAVNAYRVRIAERVAPRCVWSAAGLIVLPDAKSRTLANAGIGALGIAGTAFAVLAPLHLIDLELSGGQRLIFSIAAAVAAATALTHLLMLARHGSPRVQLGANTITIFDGMRRLDLPWDNIATIKDHPEAGRSHTGHTICVVPVSGRAYNFEQSGSYTPGGIGLFWMLRFYWSTPEARAELGDGRAAERYLAGRFPV